MVREDFFYYYFFKKMVHNTSETGGEGSLKICSSTKGRLCHISLPHLMLRGLSDDF